MKTPMERGQDACIENGWSERQRSEVKPVEDKMSAERKPGWYWVRNYDEEAFPSYLDIDGEWSNGDGALDADPDEVLRAIPGPSELEAAERRAEAAEQFFDEIWESHTGSHEGCDIEEAAIRFGLVNAVEVHESCAGRDETGETCACTDYEFPTVCMRKIPRAAIAARKETT